MIKTADLFDVSGKTVLITGGSRGIGEMLARGFVEAGSTVIIASRKAQACHALAEELSRHGTCIAAPADLSTAAGVAALVEFISVRYDGLDVLINNAGATWGAPLEEFPESGFDRAFDLNVKSLFLLTQGLLPFLRAAALAQNPARVINIGSMDGVSVSPMDNYSYGASKAAVHMLTRKLARSLAPEDITVNAIAPGPFPSDMMSFQLDDPQRRNGLIAGIPLGRAGSPEDIQGAAQFLSSRAGSYLTAVILAVDGGATGAN